MNASITRRHWLFALGAAALFATVLMVRNRALPRSAPREALAALRAELESLRDCDDLRLRGEREALARLGAAGVVSRELPGWQRADPSGARWTVAAHERWSDVISALRTIEGAPLQQLEIRTQGSLSRREIASIEAVLARPAATPPRRDAGGAASAARIGARKAEDGRAPLAALAVSRGQNSEKPMQP